MKRLSEAVKAKQRLIRLQQIEELRNERDTLRRNVISLIGQRADLETQLRIVTNERDEARALGRCS